MGVIDGDLSSCLIHNPQEFREDDIKDVLAVIEGQHDGDNYQWVLELKDGRFVYVDGWCDYTGWDCQSGANSWITNNAIDAACYSSDTADRDELIRQIVMGKAETWREKTDKALGVDSTDPDSYVDPDLDGAL